MTSNKSDLPYWIALAFHPKIGPVTFSILRASYPSFGELWRASKKDLVGRGITGKIADIVLEARQEFDPDRCLALLRRLDIGTLSLLDEKYPSLLREIPDAPFVLFVRGRLSDDLSLAVVGTRKFTAYGKRVTEELISALVANEVTIVSGLALGIDGIAHTATLENGGTTIAVLGSGLDKVYPASHAAIAESIVEKGGAVISEFPPGTISYRSNFPIRNRIIAGLTLGTVVIEAAADSGSLLTAKAALDYNREVFAVPGEIFRETSTGTNNLIKMGAKVVTSADDILVELSIPQRRATKKARNILPDTPEEAALLAHISSDPIHIDAIVKSSKIDVSKAGSLLLLMEMKGKVRNVGGNQYVKAST